MEKEWCSLITLIQCYLKTPFNCAGSLMIKHLTVDQVDEGLNDVHGRTNVAGGRTPRATPSSAPMP